jgi:hypothetical protein
MMAPGTGGRPARRTARARELEEELVADEGRQGNLVGLFGCQIGDGRALADARRGTAGPNGQRANGTAHEAEADSAVEGRLALVGARDGGGESNEPVGGMDGQANGELVGPSPKAPWPIARHDQDAPRAAEGRQRRRDAVDDGCAPHARVDARFEAVLGDERRRDGRRVGGPQGELRLVPRKVDQTVHGDVVGRRGRQHDVRLREPENETGLAAREQRLELHESSVTLIERGRRCLGQGFARQENDSVEGIATDDALATAQPGRRRVGLTLERSREVHGVPGVAHGDEDATAPFGSQRSVGFERQGELGVVHLGVAAADVDANGDRGRRREGATAGRRHRRGASLTEGSREQLTLGGVESH